MKISARAWPPPHPSVPTHCFYSTGVPTPEIFKYSEDFPEISEPVAEAGEEGDGQVSREGGEVCLRWAEGDAGRGYPSQAHHYRGIHHVDLFQEDGVLEAIAIQRTKLITSAASIIIKTIKLIMKQ